MPRKKSDPSRTAEMIRLLEHEGLTYDQVGQKFGVTRQRVHQLVVREGFSIKDVRQAEKEAWLDEEVMCSRCHQLIRRRDKGEHSRKGNHARMKLRPASQMARDLELVADYDSGMKVKDIMAKHHVSATTITHALWWMERVPDRRPRKRLPSLPAAWIRKADILADYQAEELTLREIAAKHDCSPAWVELIAHQAGVTGARGRRRVNVFRKRGLNAAGRPLTPRNLREEQRRDQQAS